MYAGGESTSRRDGRQSFSRANSRTPTAEFGMPYTDFRNRGGGNYKFNPLKSSSSKASNNSGFGYFKGGPGGSGSPRKPAVEPDIPTCIAGNLIVPIVAEIILTTHGETLEQFVKKRPALKKSLDGPTRNTTTSDMLNSINQIYKTERLLERRSKADKVSRIELQLVKNQEELQELKAMLARGGSAQTEPNLENMADKEEEEKEDVRKIGDTGGQ